MSKSKYFKPSPNEDDCEVSTILDERKRDNDNEESSIEEDLGQPFCGPPPSKYRCRFRSTCEDCFEACKPCLHFKENRLNLLLCGNNPSTHVWEHGFNYGNPTNLMWKLLTGDLGRTKMESVGFESLLPHHLPLQAQNRLPDKFKIGFADIGLVPGNVASEIDLKKWVPSFYARLRSHVLRVHEEEQSSSYKGPLVLAFTGKSQFQSLYPSKVHFDFGKLDIPFPPGFPFSPLEVTIWILPSSSGRAAMTHQNRVAPYHALAHYLREKLEERS